MKEKSKKGLKADSSKGMAISRAKRTHSSAPVGKEFYNYRSALLRGIKGQKNPKILILGATPELRDLVIKLGGTSVAADISQPNLDELTKTMVYRDHPRNIKIKADWLDVPKIFKPESFSGILADVSLSNIPYKKQNKLVSELAALIQPKGFFITRNFVFLKNKPKDNLKKIQKKYDQGKVTWLWLGIHLGLYSTFCRKLFNLRRRELPWGISCKFVLNLIKTGKFRMKKGDKEKFENVSRHGSKAIHVFLFEEEWKELVKKYFIVKNKLQVKGYEWTEYAPIWVLIKK